MARYRPTRKGRDRLRRWLADRSVSFSDWPGTVHEVAGRQVKAICARNGYALWLLDASGRPALPVPTGGTRSLRESLVAAREFFEKLDGRRKE